MADTPVKSIKALVTDFLGSAPTLEEIATYRLPDELQDRAHELLDKNRTGNLTNEERAEMEQFRQIDHLLTLIKAKAWLRLQKQAQVSQTYIPAPLRRAVIERAHSCCEYCLIAQGVLSTLLLTTSLPRNTAVKQSSVTCA